MHEVLLRWCGIQTIILILLKRLIPFLPGTQDVDDVVRSGGDQKIQALRRKDEHIHAAADELPPQSLGRHRPFAEYIKTRFNCSYKCIYT